MVYEPARQASQTLLAQHVIGRIWRRDVSVWTPDPAGDAAKSIANRLGWLTIHERMLGEVDDLKQLARGVREDEMRDVVLLGMGGSSLAPEVL